MYNVRALIIYYQNIYFYDRDECQKSSKFWNVNNAKKKHLSDFFLFFNWNQMTQNLSLKLHMLWEFHGSLRTLIIVICSYSVRYKKK